VSLRFEVKPASGSSLAGGMLVEASILARLFGMRLLTLDASVVLLPAALSSARPIAANGTTRASASVRGLGDAVRRIDESAELLAQARRNRSRLRP
jgi:hypothetical protein